MRIYRIKNKYIYRKAEEDKHRYSPDGYHDYIGFYSKKDKGWELIGLTHVLDKKRQRQIENSEIKMMTFKAYRTKKGIDIPSGVKKDLIKKDINGKKIKNMKSIKASKIKDGVLSKQQAILVSKFVK